MELMHVDRQPRRRNNSESLPPAKLLGLTQNQYELLSLYARGLTVKEIAEQQSRGISTVYQSLSRIKMRLNIERDADLIAFAIQHGLRELKS